MLKKELRYSFRSLLLYFSMLLVPISWLLGTKSLWSNIKAMQDALASGNFSADTIESLNSAMGNINGYAFFKEGIHEFFLPFALVLAASLLFSGKFNYDKSSGFGNSCVTRTGFRGYFWNRVTYTFMGSFLFTFLIMLLILLGSLVVFSAQIPGIFFGSESGFPLINLYSTQPIFYCLLLCVNMSLYTGIFALYGMGASVWITNRFIASLVPTTVFIIGIMLPQFARLEPLRWIYSENISAFFGSGGLISDLYSPPVRYLLVWLVFLTPLIITLPILYYKNKKQYIR